MKQRRGVGQAKKSSYGALNQDTFFDARFLTYRKPFDILAEGLSHLNWLPMFEKLRNWLCTKEAKTFTESANVLKLITVK